MSPASAQHRIFSWLKAAAFLPMIFTGLVLIYLIIAFVLGLIPVNSDHVPPVEGVEIHLRTNGVHVDILIPIGERRTVFSELLPEGHFTDPSIQALAFGWGDRAFYIHTPQWSDLSPGIALQAIFWPSASALHVDPVWSIPIDDPDHVSIMITEAQFELLIRELIGSFTLDANGRAIPIEAASHGAHDRFYEAHGKYHLINTSNTWTGDLLKKIGVRTAVWSPFDKAIMYHARRIDQ